MEKILLDTNFLMAVFQFKIDIFSEIERICNFNYKLFILDKTVDELKKIMKEQKGKNKDAAKFALKLVTIKNISEIKTEKNVSADQAIVNTAQKGFIVATQDKALKKSLRMEKIQVIALRQKKYLILA